MRCASITVGITAYDHRHYRESDMRLLYAEEDAKAFYRYVSTAFDQPGGTHFRIPDADATLERLKSRFEELAGQGPFDLLVVYLSGHGESSGARSLEGWFCMKDAAPGTPSLDRRTLDELFAAIGAARVLLLIDCCFAEAVVSGSEFFGRLGADITRVFVASARASQRSWEDDGLKRSVFSDVLLRALSTESDIADADGQVDLEGKLLPRLREQVPLLTVARKEGQVQEPVVGGMSVSRTLLPVVTTQSLGRQLTISQTVGRRIRRGLVIAACMLVMSLLFLDLAAYHIAVAGAGELHVRPGLRATYYLMPFHLGQEVDTGFRLDNLDQRNESLFENLSRGVLWGFVTHEDERGLKRWLTQIESGLAAPQKSSTEAFSAGVQSIVSPDDQAPPFIEAAFLSQAHARSIDRIGPEMYPARGEAEAACAENARLRIDETVLSPSPEVFAQQIKWRVATAAPETESRARVAINIIRLAAYRFLHEKNADIHKAEFTTFAQAIRVIAASSADRAGLKAKVAAAADLSKKNWCSMHFTFAVAALSSEQSEQAQAEAFFWNVFASAYRKGDPTLVSEDEDIARLSLQELAHLRPLSQQTLEGLDRILRAPGANVVRTTDAITLLQAIAPLEPLPRPLTAAIQVAMETGDDFSSLEAFTLLAANSRFLDNETRFRLNGWATQHLTDNRTMSLFHEGLGYLAQPGFFPSGYRDVLASRLSPASRFEPKTTNYLNETIINSTSDQAVVALGRAARAVPLPRDLLERLANTAAARPSLEERQVVIEGLAARLYANDAELPDTVRRQLASEPMDSKRRSLAVEIAAAKVRALTASSQASTLSGLLRLWRSENEPEIKIALARVIGSSILPPFVFN